MSSSLLAILGVWLASTIVSMLVAGAVLLTLPADYLREGDRSPRHWTSRIVRTVLGVILVAAGLVLSVPGIPGQGILTIIAGLTLIEFPGRHRLIRAMIGRPRILGAVNRFRGRFNYPPFRL